MMISSVQNPRVKQVLALRDRREREQTGLTRVEGYEEVRFALQSGGEATVLFFCPGLFQDGDERTLLEEMRERGVEVNEVTERVFEKIAYREGADGWLAVFHSPSHNLAQVRVPDNALVVVANAVEKPGNLGAMLRTAEAAGVDGLISADAVTDWGNPNVIRASKAAVYSVPVATATSDQAITWLHAHEMQIIVAAPQARTVYTDVELTGAVALVVGSEKYGVSHEWLDRADKRVQIPMSGRVDSLNVATCAALLMYEAVRQRRARTVS